MTTTFLGSIEVADGFNGDRAVLHLCRDEAGQLLAVHPLGWFVFQSHHRGEMLVARLVEA